VLYENTRVKFQPGNSGGRAKGTPNKITRSVRGAFEQVFLSLQEKGGASSLEKWADNHPAAFYQLAARLIPAEMQIGLLSGALVERLISARKATGKHDDLA